MMEYGDLLTQYVVMQHISPALHLIQYFIITWRTLIQPVRDPDFYLFPIMF